MKNSEQPYDVAGYVIASRLLILLVRKGLITAEEGKTILEAAASGAAEAPALRTTNNPILQISQLITDTIRLLDQDSDEYQKPQPSEHP